MAKARKEVELAVRVGNKTGALGEILRAVSSVGVNILAYCCYSDRDQGVVLLVTEDALKTQHALEAAGYVCRANTVVVVGAMDHVGAAAQLGNHFGQAGVDILYSYASSGGTANFCAVFKTADDDQAIHVLETARITQTA